MNMKNKRGRAAVTLPGGHEEMQYKKQTRIYAWIIFFSGFLLYANTLHHTYVIDDNIAIYGNKLVQKGIAGIPEIFTKSFYYGSDGRNYGNYRPLTSAVFAAETEFFGKNGYHQEHFLQVLFYALSGLLLFNFLRKIFRHRSPVTSLLITLLFIAHPLHTEVVANIKSLDEILCLALGYLLPVIYLLKYLESGKTVQLLFGYLFFLAGLFSKESAITFTAAIPCTLYFFREVKWKKILYLTAPLIVLSGFYMLIRLLVLDEGRDDLYGILDNVLFAAGSLSERYATTFVFLLKDIRLLFFPHPLTWDYSYNQVPLTTWADAGSLISLLLHLFLLGYALYGFRKKNVYSFCILFYFITLSVSSSLFVIIGGYSERFLFTPSLVFSVFSVFVMMNTAKMQVSFPRLILNSSFGGVFALILLLYSVKTISRNADWKDQYSIMSSGVEVSPNSAKAHGGLGSYYAAVAMQESNPEIRRDLLGKAVHEYETILSIYAGDASLWYQAATLYFQYGDYAKAEQAYKKNLELHPKDLRAYNNIAGLYYFRKDYAMAFRYFEEFVAHNPDDRDAVANLGVVCMDNLHDTLRAQEYFKRAVEIDSSYAMAYERMGVISYSFKKYPEALENFSRAYRLSSSQKILTRIADSYHAMGDEAKAAEYYSRAGER